MFQSGVFSLFSRFTANNVLAPIRNVCISAPLYLNVTNVLFAEPLKKKKKMDPGLIKAREERRKKRLEKAIRRLEKHSKQMKPIAEIDITLAKKAELEAMRKAQPVLKPEELEAMKKKLTEWNILKRKEHRELCRYINNAMTQQDEDLDKLRLESEEKYQKAIQFDPKLLPFSYKGPSESPPVKDFEPPDGEYKDITRKFEGET